MIFPSKESEKVIDDVLYKMQNELNINLDNPWLHIRIYQFLNDIWETGVADSVLNLDESKIYDKGYNKGYDDGKEDYQTGDGDTYEDGYQEGYKKGNLDGYQRALSRFNNPDVG